MTDSVTLIAVALIGQLGVILAVVIPLLWSARRHAAATNRAVNNVTPGEKPLVKKFDDLAAAFSSFEKKVESRFAVVDEAVAHVSGQATDAASLAAEVKADLDGSHERADAVPASAPPGVAADAALTSG